MNGASMEMKLEVVLVPVSDVDRAKAFYESLGWRMDIDYVGEEPGFRVVQFTPPGSECSIIIGEGITAAEPGSYEGLQLTVFDIEAARSDLVGRGVEVSEIFHDAGGIFHHAGTTSRVSGAAPEHADYGSFASFNDPDGNGWLLQEIRTRARVGDGPGSEERSEDGDDLRLGRGAWRRHCGAPPPPTASTRKRIGEADPDWPDWYAEYMVREQAGEELPR